MIRLKARTGGGCWRLEARGHAEYNPGGPDIVCAAASALCCALGRSLEQAQAPGLAALQRPGYFALRVRPDGPAHWAMIALTQTGLDMLVQRYPGHIAWQQGPSPTPDS